MKSTELRQKFRDFFTARDHAEIPSASLIPASDDPTVLFTTAGMQPLVPYFLGTPHPKGKRIFDAQKSFRTPDIDEVGDDTHHTFFEMLGNWSLGDYFKEEAIDLAYDFFIDELKLDPARLSITIFAGDDDAPKDIEARDYWLTKAGITAAQIFEFDKADNFWGPAGKTGPCGPCSEIHYDRGEAYGEFLGPNVDDNQRVVEIWNLVFMEYNKNDDGSYSKLSQKNVDTGVGFERLLAVMNNTTSAFDTDLFANIISTIEQLSGTKYADAQRAFRIIADHARGATFLIGDGVTFSNEGRGYVLRRLVRRAVREGRRLGIADEFLAKIAAVVAADFGEIYPELREGLTSIQQLLTLEEKNFSKTLREGEQRLDALLAEHGAISGRDAFTLFDTYGYPFDLSKDFAAEHGLDIDEAQFDAEMTAQQQRSRAGAASKFDGDNFAAAFAKCGATEFAGDTGAAEVVTATIIAIAESPPFKGDLGGASDDKDDSHTPQPPLKGGLQSTTIILDRTPFYAESGGQVGDSGTIVGTNGTLTVSDTQKNANKTFLHTGELTGALAIGDTVECRIDSDRRGQITRHHSLAHLFLGAAQQVLGGKDLHQAGSHVDERRMRLDFTFPRALTGAEITQIEDIIAAAVTAAPTTEIIEKSLADAKSEGVEATFGEKYGDTVRTVRMGEYSYELCGGTHVANIAQIGAVKIISETGVSAGIRRVEVVCGAAAQQLLQDNYAQLTATASQLKTPVANIDTRIAGLFAEQKQLKNALGAAQASQLDGIAAQLASDAADGIAVVVDETLGGKLLAQLARKTTAAGATTAIVIGENGAIAVAGGAAGDTLRAVTAKFGGKGGGGGDFAQGGGVSGADVAGVRAAL